MSNTVSVKLFENYDAWLENRFLELGATFTAITIRDSMNLNEGLLQVYDSRNLHVGLTGNEIIQISGSSSKSMNRIYGIKHNSVSVDSKGDNLITFNLIHIHKLKRLKFSRSFYPDAKDTLDEMIDIIYRNTPLLRPLLNGIGINVPKVPWVLEYSDYINFSKEHGISSANDSFPFIWEDVNGINIYDHKTLLDRTAIAFKAGEPSMVGQFVDSLEKPIAYDIEYLTKNNPFIRNAFGNCTYYTHSFLDKDTTRIIAGDGHNSVLLTRSGGYSQQQYRNGYEEYTRMHTMSQYDSYIKFTTIGNYELTPGLKVNIFDDKNQFMENMFIDDVVHEITTTKHFTHIYCFATSYNTDNVEETKIIKDLEDVKAVEVITSSGDLNVRDEKGGIDYESMISLRYKLKDVSTKTAVSSYKISAQNNLNENQIISNLKNLAENVLEPIKTQYPNMIVTSGFRGGLGNSQHLKGEAVDMQFTNTPKSKYFEIAKWIRANVAHDQLLLEYKTTGTGNPWIHVSLKRTTQRSQALTFMNNRMAHNQLVQMA